jgi:K+-transporting ATPase ATPase C chain
VAGPLWAVSTTATSNGSVNSMHDSLNPLTGLLPLTGDGAVVGSLRIAQEFTRSAYLWPRPSAVGYDAAAGGANLSPANPRIAERARELLARPGITDAGPVPAELVLASGSGLDAHVTLAAALYQAPRIAAARGVDPEAVAVLFAGLARDPGGGLARVRLVNVLAANLALDEAYGRLRAER